MVALGLCGRQWAFSSCVEWKLLSGCGAQASHHSGFSFAEHRLWGMGSVVVVDRLSHPHGMWDLSSGLGIKPVCPTLESRFLSTRRPGESPSISVLVFDL